MNVDFLLLSTREGRSGRVTARLAEIPEVKQSQLLFGDQIAVRLEGPTDAIEAAVGRLQGLPDVAGATLYPGNRRKGS